MCCRGDIYYADLGAARPGSCQCGLRPVLVVSNDTVNVHGACHYRGAHYVKA